jgi:ABC-type transporter MlaC component
MLRLIPCFCLSLLLAAPAWAADQSPRAYTETLLNNFKQIHSEKGLAPAEKAANEKIVNELEHTFNFEEMTTKLMAPRIDKFSAAEKEAFRKKFRELVRAGAFINSGDFFRKAKLQFQPEKTAGDMTTVPVHVTVAADDTDMVVGLLIDGDSLVKDYQNQVARLVDKKGVPSLLQSLDERRANIDKKPSAEKVKDK